MRARLFSKVGETRGAELELAEEATIGRDPGCSLVIDRPMMSSRHARIAFDAAAGHYVVEDLGSLNGTDLDGDPIIGPQSLDHLHVITFAGTYDFIFQDRERCARPDRPAAEPPSSAGEKADRRPQGREVTAVEEEAVALPSFLVERADDVQQGGSGGREITAVEEEAVALPSFLAERADKVPTAGQQADSGRREVTAMEEEAVALPSFLAERADDVQTAGREEDEKESFDEGTLHEKVPVAVPGVLGRQARETIDSRGEPQQEPTSPGDLAKVVDDLLAAPPSNRFQLVVQGPEDEMRYFELEEGENLVGRGTDASVLLEKPDLSRRHANLTVAGERVTVRDLGSHNRTFLEGEPIAVETEVEVLPHAKLRFGSIEARLILRGES